MKKSVLILPLVALLGAGLIPLQHLFATQWTVQVSTRASINQMATYQAMALSMVIGFLLVLRNMFPDSFRHYWSKGNMAAPAKAVKILGIRAYESWRSVGTGFLIAVTLATATFMWFGFYQKTAITWVATAPWVLLFALSNAFIEEMLFRFSLVVALEGIWSQEAICWSSAAIFGCLHYFGTPGGILGVMMAGFLGWLLTKSMLETKGFGWAWCIHFVQDVVILFALIGLN
jgi:hypothetical protein